MLSRWRKGRGSGRESRQAGPRLDGSDYFLRLNAQARILECSPALQRQLAWSAQGNKEASLADLVVAPNQAWLAQSPEQWPKDWPPLEFKSSGSNRLILVGSLWPTDHAQHGEWLLVFVDVSASAQRLDHLEQARRLRLDTARYATSLRGRTREPERVSADWLEALVLRLGIPFVAVLQREMDGWRTLSQYGQQQARDRRMAPDELPFLANGSSNLPLQTTSLLGEPVWAVPYMEEGAIRSWLCCCGIQAAEALPWLDADDWLQLFAMIAGPLRQQLQQRTWQSRAERYDAVEAVSAGGWWEYRRDTQSLQFSPGLARVLGLPAQGLSLGAERGSAGLAAWGGSALSLGDWLQHLEPRDRDEFVVRLEAAADGKGMFMLSVRLLVGDEACWYRLEGKPTSGEPGRVVGFALNTDDIRQREEEAEASKARLAGLVDSVPGMIYVQRYDEGALRLEFCSASSQSLLGWTQQDLQEGPYASFLHPDDHDLYFQKDKELLRQGRADCQYRMRNSSGDYRWLQDEAHLLRDDMGQPLEVVGVCLDVTDTKEAIERVFRSEENYRALVDDSPAIICRYKPDLSVIFANPALADLLSMPREQVVGLNLGDYLSPEDKEAALARLRNLSPGKPTASTEVCIKRSDLDYRWWIMYERGMFDSEGQLLEVQAVGRDNTEVHQTRQQLFQSAKMVTLGEMAAGLAHEINQPLSVIQMTLTNLLGRINNATVTREYLTEKLERIAGQVQRSAGIVNHVRIFGRWMGPEGVMFSPEASVEGALSLVGQKLKLQDIDVQLVGMSDLPQIKGHPDRLEQVMINLLMNASYAVCERQLREPELKPWIQVSASRLGGMLRMEVEDNGGGIPEALLPRIFEPFFTTKSVDQGTGLGLSVSREIITQMQGRLQAENRKEGACFLVELPIPEQQTGTDEELASRD